MEQGKAIRQVFEKMAAAWAAGDADAYAELFSENGDYVTFMGDHLRGRAANADAHRQLFGGFLRGSSLEFDAPVQIRFLHDDIAIAHTTGSVKLRWMKKAPRSRRSIQTMVLQRQAQEWKVCAFQNTRIKPPGLLLRFLQQFKK